MESRERDSIEFFFEQKDTDELFSIWNIHNTEDWREEVFEVIEQLLINRTGEKPIHIEETKTINSNKNMSEFAEDDQPDFYDPEDVEKTIVWLGKAPIIAVILSIFVALTNYQSTYSMISSWFYPTYSIVINLIIISIVILIIVANSVFIFLILYFPFRAFGLVLKILKEMEFHSRKPIN